MAIETRVWWCSCGGTAVEFPCTLLDMVGRLPPIECGACETVTKQVRYSHEVETHLARINGAP